MKRRYKQTPEGRRSERSAGLLKAIDLKSSPLFRDHRRKRVAAIKGEGGGKKRQVIPEDRPKEEMVTRRDWDHVKGYGRALEGKKGGTRRAPLIPF